MHEGDEKIMAAASVDNTVDALKLEQCCICGDIAPRHGETINKRPKCKACCKKDASDEGYRVKS